MKKLLLAGRLAVAFAAAGLGFSLFADEVSADVAREAVEGWAALKEALTGSALFADAEIDNVATYAGKDGRGVFHVVSFKGGGFAVTSGDTEIAPILAYSEEGEFAASDDNPLWTLLTIDVAGRTKRLEDAQPAAPAGRRLLSAGASSNASSWARLRAAADQTAPVSGKTLLAAKFPHQTSISEPIYGPLCKTRWNQYFVGDKVTCYNYYTPSNFLAGCVAVAMAQTMRVFEWPKEKASLSGVRSSRFLDDVKTPGVVYTNQWHVGGQYGDTWEYPGPAFGGPYDWVNMIDNPANAVGAGTLTEVQRQAIGLLCRDCGISVNMDYNLGGSGADTSRIANELVETFGYKNAALRSNGQAITLEEQLAAYLPSFAMGSPCVVGIPGHAVVADGYGINSNGRQYIHYNYGWGNNGATAWYTPPDESESDVEYPTVKKLVYNIMTPEAKYDAYTAGASFVSGAVVEEDGATPVPGAVVTARDSQTGARIQGVADENGEYVLNLPAGYDYTIEAATNGVVASTKKLGMVKCISDAVGNRRNVRLVLGDTAASAEAKLVHRWSFNGTGDTNFTDSIGGAVAKVMKKTSNTTTVDGGTVSWADGKAVLAGGNGTGHLNFGTGILGSGSGATLEVWVTKKANPGAWSYLVNYGIIDEPEGKANHFSYAVNRGSAGDPGRWGLIENRVNGVNKGGCDMVSPPVGAPYHVVLSLEDKGDGTTDVRWLVNDATTGFIYSKQHVNITEWTLASAAADGWALRLGNNPWPNSTKDLACEIDEVRIWDGVLSDEQIKASIIAGPDNPLGGAAIGVDIPANTTFTVPTIGGYGYMTFSPVKLGDGAKIRFETADYFGTGLRFKTGGIIAAGSVLDYVELDDPENYVATMEDADTILVRLKPAIAYESVWKGGKPSSAADLANPANWTSVNAAGETISAAPGPKTTVIIPSSALASFTVPADASLAWGRVIAGGRTATQCGRYGTKPNAHTLAFREIAPGSYTSLGALGFDAINGSGTAWQAANIKTAQVRFDGWVYVGADQAGKWDIQTDFDDISTFALDGEWVFINAKWEPNNTTAGCFVSEGWHRFTFIGGDTSGGYGSEVMVGEVNEDGDNRVKVPFSISINGAEPIAFYTLAFGDDAGNVVLSGNTSWSALGTLGVAPGTTIDLNGHKLAIDGLSSDGVGASVVNSVPASGGLVIESIAADAISSVRIDSSVQVVFETVLTHRWSFNDDWSDSVSGATAQKVGSFAALYGGRVHTGYGGCGHDTGNVKLGANLLDTTEATIELWARQDAVENYSRVFTYGQDSSQFIHMAWSLGTDISKDEVGAKSPGTSQGIYEQNTMAPYEIGTDYYIAFTFKRQGDGMLVSWQRRDAATGELQKSGSLTMTQGIHTFVDPVLHLGRSVDTGNCDAMAAYDEVRIWRGVLSDAALEASAKAGPDAAISIADGTPQFAAPEPPEPPTQREAMPEGGYRMMTYNINYAYDAATKTIIEDRIADRIIKENPDFCCLNEIRDVVGHTEATMIAKLTGMHKTFYGEGSQGNCVLSKKEPVSWKWTALSHAGYKRFLVVAEFDNIVVAATHLEQAGTETTTAHDARMASISEIREFLAQFAESGKPILLGGDWNAKPTSTEIASIKEFMTIVTPTSGVRTYHGRSATGGGYIIDYIAVDTAHAADIYTSDAYVIDDITASDHNPVFVEFYLRPQTATLDWIDEAFLTTGRTGNWTPEVLWNEKTWKAELFGTKSFAPLSASKGATVVVDVTASFDNLPIEKESPPEGTGAAVWLGTEGLFQLWTRADGAASPDWLDVAADGVTPAIGVDYTFRFVFDYARKTYSASVKETASSADFIPLAADGGAQTSFPLCTDKSALSVISFLGDGFLTSIKGRYSITAFAADDQIVLADNPDRQIDADEADWLNSLGDKSIVAGKIANISTAEFDKAHLLNLDLTDENGLEYSFEVTKISAVDDNVEIGLRLARPAPVMDGEKPAAIRGVLRVYGASKLGEFSPRADAEISDATFAESEEATVTIANPGSDSFFQAKIEKNNQ